MDGITQFLMMGGYARFVWPAYALAVLVLGGFAVQSLCDYRRVQRALAEQEGRRK